MLHYAMLHYATLFYFIICKTFFFFYLHVFFNRFLRKIAYATKVAEQEDTEEEEDVEEDLYEVRCIQLFHFLLLSILV